MSRQTVKTSYTQAQEEGEVQGMNSKKWMKLTILWLLAMTALNAQVVVPIETTAFPEVNSRLGALLATSDCSDCSGSIVTLNEAVTVDFSGAVPTLIGGAELAPYFSFEKVGVNPHEWKAIFDLGNIGLRVAPAGSLVTSAGVNQPSPGLEIHTNCDIVVDPGALVGNPATNAHAGKVQLTAAGRILVAGSVESVITGTWGAATGLALASGCGELRITPTGRVILTGAQQGGGEIQLLSFGVGGDVVVEGLVDSTFLWGGDSASVTAVAFAASITVDGNTTYGLEQWTDRRISSGLFARSINQQRVTSIRVQARDDVTIQGFGLDSWRGGSSQSFQLHQVLRGNANIPVTATLTNIGPDQVELRLDIDPGSGGIKAFYGNVSDHSLLNNLTITGPNAGTKFQIGADAVNGLPNLWMSPPGNWDFGSTIGDFNDPQLASASVILSAPGLTWEQLITGQANEGIALAAIVVPAAAPGATPGVLGKNDDGMARMGFEAPVFNQGKQFGALKAFTKGPGGIITVVSLNGNVRASDRAIDNDNPSGGTVTIEAWGRVDLTTSHPTAALAEGGRKVIEGGPGGANKVRSFSEGILVGAGAVIRAEGGANTLTACSGVTTNGAVTPADLNTADDSGSCPPPLTITVTSPQEGLLFTQGTVLFAGAVSEAEADIYVDGVRVTGGTSAWQAELAYADGIYQVTVAARRGNREAEVVRGFTVDTQAPAIDLVVANHIIQGETLEVTWEIIDTSALTLVEVFVNNLNVSDAASGSYSLPIPYDAGLTEIPITINATDAAGFSSPPAEVLVTVNPASVNVAISAPEEGLLTNANTVTVSGTVSPPVAIVQVNTLAAVVDGGNWSVDVPLGVEGIISLIAQAGFAGMSGAHTRNITRDITLPTLDLTAPTEVELGSSFTYSWDAQDSSGFDRVEVRLDGQLLHETAQGGDSHTATIAGAIVLELFARDLAGNEKNLSATVIVVTTPLLVAVTSPAEGALLASGSVDLNGTYGPSAAVVTVDGQTASSDGSNWWISLTYAEGVHSADISVSHGGNTEQANRTFSVDLTPPVVSLDAPLSAVVGLPFTYSWSATDSNGIGQSQLDLDGALLSEDAAGSMQMTPRAAGELTFSLNVEDNAGHTNQVVAVVVVSADLVLSVDSPGEGALVNHSPVTLSGTYAPADAVVTVDGNPAVTDGANWTIELPLEEGTWDIPVVVSVGGQTSGVNRVFSVDTSAPVVTIDGPFDVYTSGSFLLTVNAADDGSGLASFQVSVNGVIVHDEVSSPFITNIAVPTDFEQGDYMEIIATATDLAGLDGGDGYFPLIRPNEVFVTVTAPLSSSLNNSSPIRVEGTVDPAGAVVLVDETPVIQDGAHWFVDLALEDARHELQVTASFEGFTPADFVHAFLLDTSPPVIDVNAPPVLVRGESYTIVVTIEELSTLKSVDTLVGEETLPTDTQSVYYHQVEIDPDEIATSFPLEIVAIDENDYREEVLLNIPIANEEDLDVVSISVASPARGSIFAEATQTLLGSVDPLDATVTMNGREVTVTDGQFSIELNLLEGYNLISLEGRAPGLRDGLTTTHFYRDNTPPTIRFASPGDGLVTDRTSITIQGVVNDLDGQTFTLSRDGGEVLHETGVFSEVVVLAEGSNTFTYVATDAMDNTTSESLTIVLDPNGPGLSLDHPQNVAARAAYTVDLAIDEPAAIVSSSLTIDGVIVYEANDGQPFNGTFNHDGLNRRIELLAAMIDTGGNRYEATGLIEVAFPQFVHGKVLDHGNGYPLAGVTVTLDGPTGSQSLSTDERGAYSAYVDGLPITLTTDAPGYPPVIRYQERARDSWRVPDMRLTPTGGSVSLSTGASFTNGRLTLNVAAGFGGSAQLTAIGPQNIPALLPIGYSPLGGFDLSGTEASGILQFNLADMPAVALGADLVVLHGAGADWRVAAQTVVQATTSVSVNDAGAGTYAVAVLDEGMATPALETVLRRSSYPLVAANTGTELGTDPESVSIISSPGTRVSLAVSAENLVSGTLARLDADEQHDRFGDFINPPNYDFDVFCYRFGLLNSLAGQLPVTAREEVSAGLTRYASILFKAMPGHADTAGFLSQNRVPLGNLELDFSNALNVPRITRVDGVAAADLILPGSGHLVGAFDLTVGGSYAADPVLRAVDEDASSMVMLQRLASGVWVVVDLMTRIDGLWTYAGDKNVLLAGGRVAVVATAESMVYLQGTVSWQGQASAGVLISTDQHPWQALSGSDGGYHTVGFVRGAATELDAFDPETRRSGSRSVPVLSGPLSNLDIALDVPDFRITRHQPVPGERFVATSTKISFELSLPATLDGSVLNGALSLESDGGGALSFQTQVEPGGTIVTLTPTQTLQQGSWYRVRVSSSLTSRYGDPLRTPADFRFQTAFPADLTIDLQRFTMRWTGSTMYLEAPSSAFPAETALAVVNIASLESAEFELGNTHFSQVVAALPGDQLALTATLPNGQVVAHTVSSITTPLGIIAGPTGFTTTVSPSMDLVVDQVIGDGATLITVDPLSESESNDILDQVGTFDSEGLSFIEGITLGYDSGGQQPLLKGKLTPTLVLPAEGTGVVMLVVMLPEVLAPVDPFNPDQLEPVRTAYIADQISYADGVVVESNKKLAGARISLEFDLEHSPVAGLTQSANNTYYSKSKRGLIFEMTRLSIILANSSNSGPQALLVNCMSYEHPDITRDPFTDASWHGSLNGRLPVPGAPVYGVAFTGGFPEFQFLGQSGNTGRATTGWYGVPKTIQVLDPQTGQFKVGDRGSTAIHNALGFVVRNQVLNRVTFDPAQRFTELGLDGEKPPTLKQTWEVLDDGRLNEEQTEQLINRNTINAKNGRTIRLSIESDKQIVNATMQLSGLPSPDAEQTSNTKVIFTLPEGILTSDRLLTISADIRAKDGTSADIRRDILVSIPNQGPAPKPGVPISVVTVLPERKAEDVSVGTELYISFSEPVSGISENTITLSGGGETFELNFINGLGTEVEADDRVTEIYIIPSKTLKFDTRHSLSVGNLADTNSGDPEMEPFSSWFTTARLDDSESVTPPVHQQAHAGYEHTAFASLRNLVFYMHQTPNDDTNFQLDCFDERDPKKPLKMIWSSRLWHEGDSGKTMENLIWSFALFTPEDLGQGDTPDFNTSRRSALDDLPSGTKLAVTYRHHRDYWGTTPQMRIFNYDGGGTWSLEVRFPLNGHPGFPGSVSKIGPYLAVAFTGGVGTRGGGTEVFDIRELLDPAEGVNAIREANLSGTPLLAKLQRLGLVAEYHTPSWDQGVATLLHRGGEGIKPVVLTGGTQYGGIYRFDPSEVGDVWSTPDVDEIVYDKRLLAQTTYHGFNINDGVRPSNTYPAAVEALTFRDGNTLKTRDVAIFHSYRPGERKSVVQFHVLEPNHNSGGPVAADATISFDVHIAHIAADLEKGLLAVASSTGRYGVIDVRRVLEENSNTDGFNHEAFLFPPKNNTFWRMHFNNGVLYGANDYEMRRIVIDPSPYRTVGWEVVNLDEWMDAGPGDAITTVKYEREIIFQTTDLYGENGPRFATERGSFAVQLLGPSKVKVTIKTAGDSELGSDEREHKQAGEKMEYFSNLGLHEYLSRADVRAELRQKRLLGFKICYEIKQKNAVIESEEIDFAVSWQAPKTRDKDPFRHLQGFDSLTATAEVHDVDAFLPCLDSRLNPSVQRIYRADYAFQPGDFGPGMLDGSLLYMALPVWWDSEKELPEGWHNGSIAEARLWLEQPGQFQLDAKIEDKGDTVTLLNDANSEIKRDGGTWVLNHQQNMTWRLASGAPMPHYQTLFQGWNSAFKGGMDVGKKMRYPVFRRRTGARLPGQFYAPVAIIAQADIPWGNNLRAYDEGKPSSRPSLLTWQVRDTAGQFTTTRKFERKPAGSVLTSVSSAAGAVSYSYDEEGYLQNIAGVAGNVNVGWEPFGDIKIGDFVPKRLTSIQYGPWSRTYGYSGEGLRADSLDTPFGNKSFAPAGGEGLSDTASISGIGDAPDLAVSFDTTAGTWLSSSFSSGGEVFSLTWTTLNDEQVVVDETTFLEMDMDYDVKGRLNSLVWTWPGVTESSSQSWTYDDESAIPGLPVSFTDSSGSYSLSQEQTSVSGAGIGTLKLALSGAPVGGTVDGKDWGVSSARFYKPFGLEEQSGANLSLSRHRITSFPMVSPSGKHEGQMDFSFDGSNNLTRVFGPDTAVNFATFGDDGLPATRTVAGETVSLAYSLASFFTITETSAGGGTSTRNYNEYGWLKSVAVTPAGGPAHNYEYDYDNWGRITSATDNGTVYFDSNSIEIEPAPFAWYGSGLFNPDPRRNVGGYLPLMPHNPFLIPLYAPHANLMPEPLRYRPQLSIAAATRLAKNISIDLRGGKLLDSRTLSPAVMGDVLAITGVPRGAMDTIGAQALPLVAKAGGIIRAQNLKQNTLKPDPKTNVDPCVLTILPGDHEKVIVKLGQKYAGKSVYLTTAEPTIARFVTVEGMGANTSEISYADHIELAEFPKVVLNGRANGETVLQARLDAPDGEIFATLPVKVGGTILVEIGSAPTFHTAFPLSKDDPVDEPGPPVDDPSPVEFWDNSGQNDNFRNRRGIPKYILDQIRNADRVDGVVQITVVDSQGNAKRKKVVTAAFLDKKLVIEEREYITDANGKVVMKVKVDTFAGDDEFHGADRDRMVVLVGKAAERFHPDDLTLENVAGQIKSDQITIEHDFTGHMLRFKHELTTNNGEEYLTAMQVYMPMLNHQQYLVFKHALFGDGYGDTYTPGMNDEFSWREGPPGSPIRTETYGLSELPSEEEYGQVAFDYLSENQPNDNTPEQSYHPTFKEEPVEEGSPWKTAYTVGAVTAEMAISMAPGGDFIDIFKEYIWKPWVKGEDPNHFVGLVALIGLVMDAGYFTGVGTAGAAVGNAIVGAIKFVFKRTPEAVTKALMRLAGGGMRMIKNVLNYVSRIPGNPVEVVNKILTQWDTILHTPLVNGGAGTLAKTINLQGKYLSKHMSTRASTGLARVVGDQGEEFAAKLLQKYGPCFTGKRKAEPLPCEALERALAMLVTDEAFTKGIRLDLFHTDAVEGLVRFMKESGRALDEAEAIAKNLLSLPDVEDANRVFSFIKKLDTPNKDIMSVNEIMKGISDMSNTAAGQVGRPDLVAKIVKDFGSGSTGKELLEYSFGRLGKYDPATFVPAVTEEGLLALPRILEKHTGIGGLAQADEKMGGIMDLFRIRSGSDMNGALELYGSLREGENFVDWLKSVNRHESKIKGHYFEARLASEHIQVPNIKDMAPRIEGSQGIDLITTSDRFIECKNVNFSGIYQNGGLKGEIYEQVERHIKNYPDENLQWAFSRNYTPADQDKIRAAINKVFVRKGLDPLPESDIFFLGWGDIPFGNPGAGPE